MSAPIGHTCPDINRITGKLNQMVKDINRLRSYDYEDSKLMKDIIEECRYIMDDAEDTFEDLRNSNSKLRDYGEAQEERADELEEQVTELQEKLNEYSALQQ